MTLLAIFKVPVRKWVNGFNSFTRCIECGGSWFDHAETPSRGNWATTCNRGDVTALADFATNGHRGMTV